MSFPMYTIKLSSIHWSLIWLHNRLFTIFITENDLSTVAVATGKFDRKFYIYIFIYIYRKKKKVNKTFRVILQYSLFLWVWYPLNCYRQIWCSCHHIYVMVVLFNVMLVLSNFIYIKFKWINKNLGYQVMWS